MEMRTIQIYFNLGGRGLKCTFRSFCHSPSASFFLAEAWIGITVASVEFSVATVTFLAEPQDEIILLEAVASFIKKYYTYNMNS